MAADSEETYIRRLEHLSYEDIETVGAKNATLGDMMRNLESQGIPFPHGFATTTQAYRDFLAGNALEPKMRALLKEYREKGTPVGEVSRAIRLLFQSAKLPPKVAQEEETAYERLSETDTNLAVAVRSCATADELPGLALWNGTRWLVILDGAEPEGLDAIDAIFSNQQYEPDDLDRIGSISDRPETNRPGLSGVLNDSDEWTFRAGALGADARRNTADDQQAIFLGRGE